jgi:hypothetical protein
MVAIVWLHKTQQVIGRINFLLSFHYTFSVWYDTDRTENETSNSSSAVVCVYPLLQEGVYLAVA